MITENLKIRHYLNQSNQVHSVGSEYFYPLELSIVFFEKSINVRSKIADYVKLYSRDVKKLFENNNNISRNVLQGYFSEKIFRKIEKEKLYPIYDLLMDEADFVKRIIAFHQPFNPENFTARNFTWEYADFTTEVGYILDDAIKEKYRTELKGIFARSIEPKKSRDTFQVSNYFIHHINWDNQFRDFYEMTYEVMPHDLKLVENYFSGDLKTLIKAFMAFQTQIKIIRRTFEKKEPGKISVLSWFEWEEGIKDFLRTKFEKIFGKKKSQEYVEALHKILRDHFVNSAFHT